MTKITYLLPWAVRNLVLMTLRIFWRTLNTVRAQRNAPNIRNRKQATKECYTVNRGRTKSTIRRKLLTRTRKANFQNCRTFMQKLRTNQNRRVITSLIWQLIRMLKGRMLIISRRNMFPHAVRAKNKITTR